MDSKVFFSIGKAVSKQLPKAFFPDAISGRATFCKPALSGGGNWADDGSSWEEEINDDDDHCDGMYLLCT